MTIVFLCNEKTYICWVFYLQEQYARLRPTAGQVEEAQGSAGVRMPVQLAFGPGTHRPQGPASAQVGLRQARYVTKPLRDGCVLFSSKKFCIVSTRVCLFFHALFCFVLFCSSMCTSMFSCVGNIRRVFFFFVLPFTYIAKNSDWDTVCSLQLQRVLFFSHSFHLYSE